ncbi:MAG: hypothetical protein M1153_01150 [Patescibacteria group bacterium]|nr:hypothetical protein [Patescibacteria group bacterium]
MSIFTKIKELNFPPDQYIVFGGAAIAARGIRETKDADILVTQELLDECSQDNQWQTHPRLDPNEPAGLDNGIIEIYSTIGGGFSTNFKELRANADIIDDIPFCSLEDVIRIKEAYGREKDLKDVELIKQYLLSRNRPV